MITGFNTDIEYEGVTYHVQTEDKGLRRPIILSLVYNRGTILASKRAPYDDLIKEGFSEELLAARLQKQHKLMCAAVRGGRLEDLKEMTLRESGRGTAAAASAVAAAGAFQTESVAVAEAEFSGLDRPIPKPSFDNIPEAADLQIGEPSMVEGISIIEEIVIPEEAVEIVSDINGSDRQQVGKLSIQLLGEGRFLAGMSRKVAVMICRGSTNRVVSKAQVMVKLLGSSFRPVIFHASTDTNGIANVDIQIPEFTTGRGAVLVRAIHDGEQVELRRIIVQR